MRALKLILTQPEFLGPAWVFASINILIGTWAVYIPVITGRLGISEGALGIALFFFALGTMISIPAAPLISERLGLGKSVITGVLLVCLSFVGPFLAADHVGLSVALFVVGATSGFTDIAMNTLVSELEARRGVQIMSASHGFFSLGGVLGAGLGSLLMGYFRTPLWHILIVSVVVIAINLVLARHYSRITTPPRTSEPFCVKLLHPLLALGLVSFIIMASEGAMVDWSSLYLEKVAKAPTPFLIGMGYTVFSVFMTLGRFFGDEVSHRFGSYTIIICGLLLGTGGYLLILSAYPALAITGFGCVGLGFSVIIPELFRLGGSQKDVDTAKGISFIAGTGYLGFLTGPVILGILAELYSLKLSFLALLAGAIIAAWIMVRRNKKGS
ncbi:MFS transporter [Robertkochia flava]|uniref:MFS transporter n=1 Tax=Robertkochia flava TaxID=3447986 RepID=UPI001CCAB42D|nr:MFS transporter [Robertkochia marina]